MKSGNDGRRRLRRDAGIFPRKEKPTEPEIGRQPGLTDSDEPRDGRREKVDEDRHESEPGENAAQHDGGRDRASLAQLVDSALEAALRDELFGRGGLAAEGFRFHAASFARPP